MPRPAIIVLASRIGAGKSTLAQELGQLTGLQVTSFGAYVKSVAGERNLPLNRRTLQNLGDELVSADHVSFTRNALASVDFRNGAVIDGLRHKAVLTEILSLAGSLRTVMVFIDTDEETRFNRLVARGMTLEEIESANTHTMETQLEGELLPLADMTVDGSVSASVNASDIIRSMGLQD